ncbi:hypothetical protein [Stackebrandtia albiflava]|uniref:hypothetical protein n=1 Tax=Stackebrandtia albiflava TaxID=406432 RepID=UPI0011BDA833|nr:hypothetical protein [Stackebrandtia albiflava]
MVMLLGLAGAAWLAGTTAAYADHSADGGIGIPPSPVLTPVPGQWTAAPEQAALVPESQLESATAPITDETDDGPQHHRPDGGADPRHAPDADPARLAGEGDVLPKTTSELFTPHGVTGGHRTGTGDGGILAVARPVTDSLTSMTNPDAPPRPSVATPVNGRPADTAVPVVSTLTGFTHHATAVAAPVGTMLMPAAPHPGSGAAEGNPPTGSAGADPTAPHTGAGTPASDRHRPTETSAVAERVQAVGHTDDDPGRRPEPTGDTVPRDSAPGPIRDVAFPDPGIAATGGSATGGYPAGCSPYDSGAGRGACDHTDRDAQVSRVTPTTATVDLPDHVEDPAVSPD